MAKNLDLLFPGMDIDRIELFDKVGEEARRRLDKSIAAGRRLAEGKAKASQLAEAALVGA